MSTDAKELYQLDQKSLNYNIYAGTLTQALNQYAQKAGVTLVFDPQLTQGKVSNGLKGQYSITEGFKALLQGTGLVVVNNDQGEFTLVKAAQAQENKETNLNLEEVQVRAKRFYEIGPLPGLGLTKEEIPGNVQSITAKEIKESHSLSITDLMNKKLQSVNVNDYQGNPFQMDVQYRGFTAGPQIGTPQGLSVFFDGIRVNEPFGDVVNWDMIPMNALAGVDVFPGSNPIFGLGTLGGAFALKTKDGFNNNGANAEVLAGSFGRKQLQVDGGWNNGVIALFGAGNFFLEDGWRENSPSEVNQFFGKASYRGDKLDLSLSTLLVGNDLVGNGLIPSEEYARNRNGVFTSPDTTKNRLQQFQLSGSYFVNDNFTITAQAYRRNSKRKSLGADVYTEHQEGFFRRALAPGEQFTCLFNSTNEYGLPDYYVLDAPNGDIFSTPFVQDLFINGTPNLSLLSFNAELPDYYVDYAKTLFDVWKNYRQALLFSPQAGQSPELPPGGIEPYSNGETSYFANWNGPAFDSTPEGQLEPFSAIFLPNYYYTPDGVKHQLLIINPNNGDDCIGGDPVLAGTADGGTLSVLDPNTNSPLTVDGAASLDGMQPGVVEGTPTAVLTNNDIDQITDGASVQFNWNYPKHKFMIGASIDAPSATYESGQRLGLFDAERNAFLAPDQIRDQYAAADLEISNNNFDGSQVTKSIYASETWSPIETLHITGSARYNETHGKNKIASRTFGSRVFDLTQLESVPDNMNICDNGVCPSTGYHLPDVSNLLNAPEKEKFSYYSLNPSLGVSWQAKESLNLYANWAQGTRTPSVIELGCAFDDTPVNIGTVQDPRYIAKSLQENRACSLPSTLSGDPPLPQVKANTFDIGMRGQWGENTIWNIGAYQTDLRDDIYLISFPGNRSFFSSIGDTRRRGIEAGITTVIGKFQLGLNYALTDATFEESFMMASNDNSSSVDENFETSRYGRRIQVSPGDTMPGVSRHNLNATLNYEVTPAWQVGLTAIAHSKSYVRGNENNKHQKGVTLVDTFDTAGGQKSVARKPTDNPGSIPGYFTFNFQTSYKLTPEWTLGLLVNNLFDKEYFSAGRLGRNPFSPSVYGAIGPDGYNHNSADWLSTNFIAPGAPRGAWISLRYEFKPDR
ncbi:MAG: TonB-dependent receptor domain-containing protein [Methylophilaceae bacterium]